MNIENILTAFFDTVPIPIFYKDLEGIYVDVNKSFLDTFGFEYDEIVGKTVFDIAPLEIAQGYQDADNYLLTHPDETQIYKYRVKNRRTLQQYQVTFYKNVFRDEEGNVAGLIGAVLDNTEHESIKNLLEEQAKSLKHKANHDNLTGLPNRSFFKDTLDYAMKKAKRIDTKVATYYIDLDHFKSINDTYGHDVGDEVLIQFSKKIKAILRESDMFARIGGDEFVIIVSEFEDPKNLAHLANKLIKAIEKPCMLTEETFHLQCSIGISIYPNDGVYLDEILKNADLAMYKAKKDTSKSSFYFFDEL